MKSLFVLLVAFVSSLAVAQEPNHFQCHHGTNGVTISLSNVAGDVTGSLKQGTHPAYSLNGEKEIIVAKLIAGKSISIVAGAEKDASLVLHFPRLNMGTRKKVEFKSNVLEITKLPNPKDGILDEVKADEWDCVGDFVLSMK